MDDRGGFKGGGHPIMPLILQKQGCAPLLSDTGPLAVCGCQGAVAFLLKSVCASLLKIPGSAPGWVGIVHYKSLQFIGHVLAIDQSAKNNHEATSQN